MGGEAFDAAIASGTLQAKPVEGACRLGDAPGIGITPDLQELAEVAARGC